MIYLVDPQDLAARPPCNPKCKPYSYCTIKPLYGAPVI
jgi:hypothetical protein